MEGKAWGESGTASVSIGADLAIAEDEIDGTAPTGSGSGSQDRPRVRWRVHNPTAQVTEPSRNCGQPSGNCRQVRKQQQWLLKPYPIARRNEDEPQLWQAYKITFGELTTFAVCG